MIDLGDPTPIVISNDYLELTKRCHVMGGLYIWEFFTTLDYEWSVIRGRRRYLWTLWIYSITRVATLTSVTLTLVGFDPPRQINCQTWIISHLIFAYLSLSTSLLLIALRTIAIWNREKVVMILTACIWCIHLAFLIDGITRFRSVWLPGVEACLPPNMESNKFVIIATLAADFLLVVTMLFGLPRSRDHSGGMFGLARLLWKQSVMWFLIATGAGLTTLVFLYLDLSPALDDMFLVPALVTMSITATRIYTSLAVSGEKTDYD